MQFMGRNAQTLFVWRASTTEDEPGLGDAVKKYTKAERIIIALYPSERGREQTIQGVIPTDRYTAYTHNMKLRTGDRLGPWDKPTYRIVNTTPDITGQWLLVEAIEPKGVI